MLTAWSDLDHQRVLRQPNDKEVRGAPGPRHRVAKRDASRSADSSKCKDDVRAVPAIVRRDGEQGGEVGPGKR